MKGKIEYETFASGNCEEELCDFLNKENVEVIAITEGGSNIVNWLNLFYRKKNKR